MQPKLRSVQTYFDSDANRYGGQRYPSDATTCEQLSYLVRQRYVLGMLAEGAPQPGLVLDVGCGPGVYSNELLDRGWRVAGVDLSTNMLKVARERVAGRAGAGYAAAQTTRLPFATASFDALICIGVFAYVESEAKTLDEIARVLKPGGCAVIQIANAHGPVHLENRWRWQLGQWIRRRPPDAEDRLRAQVRLATQAPGPFKALCRAHGLEPQDGGRYYDFRLPALAWLWPGLGLQFGRRFERLGGRGLFGWWGAGFVMRLVRTRT